MLDIKQALREMIIRHSRREINAKIKPLEKKIRELNISRRILKRAVDKQRREIIELSKKLTPEDRISTLPPEILKKSRLSPKLIRILRKKLKLTRNEFGKLLNVSTNTIYLWETGKVEPREKYRSKIISLRTLGKKRVKGILNLKPKPHSLTAL